MNVLKEKLLLETDKHLHSQLDTSISIKEIEKATKKLKNKKAPGFDRIRNEMLKTSLRFTKKSLSILFTLILNSGVFPTNWGDGTITAIYKSGDKNDPTNYRGICVNSCLGKLFCSILNNRLIEYSLNQRLLHRSQIGFMPNHRTSDHIFTLKTLIDKYVTHTPKGKLFSCFVDFRKAFDSIWHQGLLYKLLKYQIGGKFFDVISNMYSNSKCCVRGKTTRSDFFDYQKGVRQGCILSPILFNLYLNELPNTLSINALDPIVLPDGTDINCLLYADDLLLISHTAEGLQDCLNKLSQYCKNWFLDINHSKTKVVIFQKKTRKSTIEKYNFLVNNKQIEIVKDYTYLGVNFSSNGSFANHKEKLKEKTRRSIFATRRYLDFSKLPTKICNKIFDALFLPILTYSSEVWGAYDRNDNSTWEKDTIEKTHIYFCKLYLGVNKRSPNVATRNELGRLPLKLQISMNILKYWIHLEKLQKNSIANLCLGISNRLAEENKQCLVSKVNTLCDNNNINKTIINVDNPFCEMRKIQNSISTSLNVHQLNLINLNKKLKFYSMFKFDTKQSEFLNHIKNPLHKRTASKFRIGNHSLKIETGRFTIPKIPENMRTCPHCLTPVEDEIHFLLRCSLYNDLRITLLEKLENRYKVFERFSDTERIIFLFNNNDGYVSRLSAAFVHQAMEIREKNYQIN